MQTRTVLLHIAIGCAIGSLVATTLGAALNQVLLPALLGGVVGFFACGARKSWQTVKEKLLHPISSTKDFREDCYYKARITCLICWAVASFCFIPYFATMFFVAHTDPNLPLGGIFGLSALMLFMGTVATLIISFGVRIGLMETYDEKMFDTKECQRFPISWFGTRALWKVQGVLDRLISDWPALKKISGFLGKFFEDEYFSSLLEGKSGRKTSFFKVCELFFYTILLILLPIALAVAVIYVFFENVFSVILLLAVNKRMATFSGVVIGSIAAKALEYTYGWGIYSTALICWLISLTVAYTVYLAREYLGNYEEWWERNSRSL
jgi:hypothetical protein